MAVAERGGLPPWEARALVLQGERAAAEPRRAAPLGAPLEAAAPEPGPGPPAPSPYATCATPPDGVWLHRSTPTTSNG